MRTTGRREDPPVRLINDVHGLVDQETLIGSSVPATEHSIISVMTPEEARLAWIKLFSEFNEKSTSKVSI